MASTASNGALGYWPEPSDVVSSDPAKNSSSKGLVSPPSGWPKCFSENATLKGASSQEGPRWQALPLDGLAVGGGQGRVCRHHHQFGGPVRQRRGLPAVARLDGRQGVCRLPARGRGHLCRPQAVVVPEGERRVGRPTPRPDGVVEMVLLESSSRPRRRPRCRTASAPPPRSASASVASPRRPLRRRQVVRAGGADPVE